MTEAQRLTLQAKIINAKRAGNYWAYEKAVKEKKELTEKRCGT